ncbi:hypothetical protein [Cellulomonas sp. NS3]|uniref:hypothetical protein n=1 Tax=Cellulomonas sp. NS3 TaxID=2973977 RepID=UPI002163C4AE|nr:hypothetical protein [Cellulomonas sp. NS3]
MDEHVDTTRAVPLPSPPVSVGQGVAPVGAAATQLVPGRWRPTPASVRVAPTPVGSRDVEDVPSEDGTGDHAVDEALTLLATLDALPLREHVAVFDGVHTALQDRLADTEG